MSEFPEAYRIGNIPFLHTTIFLDSRPLIPRSETEYWVDLFLKNLSTWQVDTVRVLDMCAGSGCIGVAVAKEIPGAKVDFVEKDESHHATIRKNIEANGIAPERTRIFGGDLFSALGAAPVKPGGQGSASGGEDILDTKYNFILSNPPYIDPERRGRVQESVVEHEPGEALWGGMRGMEIVSRIIQDSPKHLKEQGVLYIEHEPEQAEEVRRLAEERGYKTCQNLKDQYGVYRYSRLDLD